MRRTFALRIAVIIAAVLCASAAPAAESGAARLVPGDRVTVTIYGQADLSGVYQIDGQGNIDLPLVGAVPVGQLTLSECEKRLEARLGDGFIRHPAVSVRVSEVRPIYVLGDVKTPGAIPFRHGGNVLAAVAQAGGFGGGDPLLAATALADFLIADERVRTLESTRRLQLIRKARLEAQRDGQGTFEVPSVGTAGEPDKQLIAAIQSERDALRTQTETLEMELELQRKQKPRLDLSYAAIEKQIEAEKTQFDLVQGQLNDMAKLQSMGLARRTTEVALQREQAALDSNMSRYRSELARLAVTIGEIDIKIQDTQNAYMRRVLAELQEVRSKLQEIETTLPSAREVREVRSEQTGNSVASDTRRTSHRIVINRMINNELRALNGTEDALLEPGDIVEVKRLRSRGDAEGLGSMGSLDQTLRSSLASDGAVARQRPE
jgi:polysaccharide export outer membrane protein